MKLKHPWWMGLLLLAPDDGAGGGGSADDGDKTGEGQDDRKSNDDGDGKPGEKGGKPPVYTQEELDRRVTEAIKTRERKLDEERRLEREKAEAEKAAAEGKFKELYEKAEREKAAAILRLQTREALSEKGLDAFAGIFEADVSTLDGRVAAAEDLKKHFDKAVEIEVLKRLETKRPGKGSPGGHNGGSQKYTPDEIAKMSQEEYEAAYKKGQIG